MKQHDFAFAAGAVRVMENSLLGKAFFDTLLQCDSYEEVKRQLADGGLERFAETDDPEAALSGYLEESYEELASLLDEKSVLDFLIVKNDFHNLKTALKALVLQKDNSALFLSPSVFPAGEIPALLSQKEWEAFPAFLKNAAREGYEIVTTSLDGQYLDLFLDARALEAQLALAGKTKSPKAQAAAKKEIDFCNYKICRRLSVFRLQPALLEAAFAEGGTFSAAEWQKIARGGEEALSEAGEALSLPQEPLSQLEKYMENELLALWQSARFEVLTPDILFAYYKAREAEWKNLSILCMGKKAGLSAEQIGERMRNIDG